MTQRKSQRDGVRVGLLLGRITVGLVVTHAEQLVAAHLAELHRIDAERGQIACTRCAVFANCDGNSDRACYGVQETSKG